ncbi:MAG: RibD family protein [Alkalispirochaeta sp.]
MAVVPLDELQVADSVNDYLHSVFFRRTAEAASQRPWVTLSWAQASDGSIATRSREPAAISGAESLFITHTLRARHSAILVGVNTVLSDDPRLTTRLVAGASPRPIVLDSHLRCPTSARIFCEARDDARPGPIILTTDQAIHRSPAAVARIHQAGGSVVRAGESLHGGVDLDGALGALWALGLESVMVEGGGRVLRSFLSTAHIDAMAVTIAPHTLDGYRPVPWELVEGYCQRGMTRRFQVGGDALVFSLRSEARA